MNIETLAKEVLNSNLSDDAKVEIMKALFKTEEKTWVPPYNIGKDNEWILNQPVRIMSYLDPSEDDRWRKNTAIAADGDLQWWKQHLENAKADCVGIGNQIIYS